MPLAALVSAFVQVAIPAAGGSLFAACNEIPRQAADIAVTALWQGAFIACGLAICLRRAPRTSAAHRFAVWAAAFAALVCLPVLALISGSPAAAAAGASSAISGAASGAWLQLDVRWSLLIAALWAAATLYRACDLVLHSFRLRKLWKHALPVDLYGRLDSMLAASSTRGPVEVCTTTTLQRPSVIGFFKPRILIPDWLFVRLTPGELEQIVLHEAEHLRRRDDWTNLFQKLCLVLFPLNPALLWIERRLCREREMACDDGVINVTHAPRAYAACLASLAERGLQRRAEALSLGAWQRRPELANRVHSILRRRHALSPLGNRALLGVVGCGLLFASMELARCPQLIAFVPARDPEPGVASARPPAQLVTAAYTPVRTAAIANAPSGSRATETPAPLSANRQARPVASSALMQRASLKQNAALEWKTSYSESDSRSPRPVMLRAELTSAEPAPDQESQWIVITTWEQVQTSNRDSGLQADYDLGASESANDDSNARPGRQPANRITVTRLILRVFPASSLFTQPTPSLTRGGWLVFQL